MSEILIQSSLFSFPIEFEFGMFLFLSLLSCRYRLSQTAWPQRVNVMEFPGAVPSRRAGRHSPISETWESRCRRNTPLLSKLKVKRYYNITGGIQLNNISHVQKLNVKRNTNKSSISKDWFWVDLQTVLILLIQKYKLLSIKLGKVQNKSDYRSMAIFGFQI